MADKYLKHDGAGGSAEQEAITTSAGAGSSGKVAALDVTGKWDTSLMPTGIGADTASILTSEDLVAGDYVNIYDNTGVFTCRKGDGTTSGKPAHGFVLSASTSGQDATVYLEGANDQVSGQVAGNVFLSTTAGIGTDIPPNGTGNVVQRLGVATSTTSVNFEASSPVTLA